jgi:hypothetical protein
MPPLTIDLGKLALGDKFADVDIHISCGSPDSGIHLEGHSTVLLSASERWQVRSIGRGRQAHRDTHGAVPQHDAAHHAMDACRPNWIAGSRRPSDAGG